MPHTIGHLAVDAIHEDDPDTLSMHLDHNPAIIHWTCIDRYTLLHFAALYESPRCVRELLRRGLDPNAEVMVGGLFSGDPNSGDDHAMRMTRDGWTPMDFAVNSGSRHIQELLAAAGGYGQKATPPARKSYYDRRARRYVEGERPEV